MIIKRNIIAIISMNKIKLGVLSFIFSVLVCHFETFGSQTVKLSFNEKSFSLNESLNGVISIESIKEIAGYPESDEPGLPLLTRNVALASNQAYKESSIKFEKRLIKENVEIEKSPTPVISDSINVHFNQQPNKYVNGGTFPMSNCKYTGISDWGGFSLCHFLATPFVYDADEKNLYFIDEMELEISTIEGKLKAQSQNVDYLPQIYNESYFKGLAINDNVISSAFDERSNLTGIIREPIEYIVITNAYLRSSFEPLVRLITV